ncbi:MAG TPA: response regulator transcription factor [Candidatus Acidoferrum sp.]|jgi:two-component system NarL family response regulator
MDLWKNGSRREVVRVFLLMRNRLLRESLLRLFRKRADLSIVGLGSPGSTDPAEVESSHCDVLLTDQFSANTPAESAIFRDQWSTVQGEILLLGMEEDQDQFLAAVRAGATGYLLKDASAGDVIAAVRGIARGEAVCPPRLCASLIKSLSGKARQELAPRIEQRPNLTLRQMQLVTLVAQGLTNKEIASQLNLSEFTVKNHLYRIMKQVDAGTRYEAVETVRAHLEDAG